MGRISEEEKAKNRGALLNAGVELFSKYGVSKTTVDDLVAKALMSKGSFYTYFESKEHLFIEIVKLKSEELAQKQYNILSNLPRPGQTGVELLMELSRIRYDFMVEEPIFQILVLPEFKEERELIARKFDQAREEISRITNIDRAADFISRLQQLGLLREQDPKKVAYMFHIIFLVFVNRDQFDPDYFDDVFDSLRDIIYSNAST